MIIAVIGKNFGDEGKGLAVDRFCGRAPFSIVVKHNGGAQAGHTVCFDGRRFVFHQLSSGSFRRADTYFAATYFANVAAILGNAGLSLDEVCYVTRTYVTRHGAGELPRECDPSQLGSIGRDLTNVPNPWQGSLRYAPHGSPEEFTEGVNEDLKTLDGCRRPAVSLCVTHLNETGGCVVCAGPDGGEPLRIPLGDFVKMPNISRLFDRVYCSFSEEENI